MSRVLKNLEAALQRFKLEAPRLEPQERSHAMHRLLAAADDLLRVRHAPVPGKAAVGLYLDELADEAARMRGPL